MTVGSRTAIVYLGKMFWWYSYIFPWKWFIRQVFAYAERVQAHFFFPYIAVTTVLGLEKGKDCIIVGTLYKHMKLKPSILDEYAKEVKCLES